MLTATFAQDFYPAVKTWKNMVTLSGDGLTMRPALHVWVVDSRHHILVLSELNTAITVEHISAAVLQWLSSLVHVIAVWRKDRVALCSCETIMLSPNFNLSNSIMHKRHPVCRHHADRAIFRRDIRGRV